MSMNPPLSNWHHQYVWVIGASTGIGYETARLLLSKGAHVAVSARKAAPLEALVAVHAASQQTAAGLGNQALALPLDITQAESVQSAAAHLLADWPRLDLVLIVAGTYNEMRVDQFDLTAVRDTLNINLLGVYHVLDVILPVLLAQSQTARQGDWIGGIGIVGSVAGYSGLPKALAYGPSKAAIINLCESLYFDLRPRGIATYLISPGFVETPLTAKNDFAMPAIISAQEAATCIVNDISAGRFDIHFPKRFTRVVKLMRLLPYSFYFWLLHRITGL